jgi:hypothetical protein
MDSMPIGLRPVLIDMYIGQEDRIFQAVKFVC